MQTTQLLKRLGTTGCQKNKNKREPMTINLTGKDVTHKLNVDYLTSQYIVLETYKCIL